LILSQNNVLLAEFRVSVSPLVGECIIIIISFFAICFIKSTENTVRYTVVDADSQRTKEDSTMGVGMFGCCSSN